ncbi:RadC family protein [Pseudoalteromonas rhizosphaerae]|uniref:RadC family protein n=1 Tax=Pseudoalteromonas rhizosphaerae TaxID=2518973 RepID=UPI00384D27CF
MFKSLFTKQQQAIIFEAAAIIEAKAKTTAAITCPYTAATLCQTKLVGYEHEVFAVALLDSQNRLIEWVELFTGTINSAGVYPREVVKLVLAHNAAAVIFAHNHPSGITKPSESDKRITDKLSAALRLIDVNVLDHIVVGTEGHTSFAERGLL